jgi:biopolymer transport protein ExbD
MDMTPLVDLGFLLITFFIFTTTLAESNVLKLIVPADATNQLSTAPESATVSALLGSNNEVYIYNGKWEDAVKSNAVKKTNYNVASGLGAMLRAKQHWLASYNRDGRKALIYLIKPAETSSFQNVVDALDEATINNIQHYVVAPLSKDEERFMEGK